MLFFLSRRLMRDEIVVELQNNEPDAAGKESGDLFIPTDFSNISKSYIKKNGNIVFQRMRNIIC